MKQMEEAMKGYHDLVDHGKREIYRARGVRTRRGYARSTRVA